MYFMANLSMIPGFDAHNSNLTKNFNYPTFILKYAP